MHIDTATQRAGVMFGHQSSQMTIVRKTIILIIEPGKTNRMAGKNARERERVRGRERETESQEPIRSNDFIRNRTTGCSRNYSGPSRASHQGSVAKRYCMSSSRFCRCYRRTQEQSSSELSRPSVDAHALSTCYRCSRTLQTSN